MKRINVIGTSGSGKSTVARNLASVLGYPHIEMDVFTGNQIGKTLQIKNFFLQLPKVRLVQLGY
ncbi:shikimate kinase [Kiloniella majae]|uniref:shikimate kinase n=1 Tax=Kiloniella majae TaxID=1938558 RepID=UPI0018E9468F|nr:shikimate kinase [Kiloniella majae]